MQISLRLLFKRLGYQSEILKYQKEEQKMWHSAEMLIRSTESWFAHQHLIGNGWQLLTEMLFLPCLIFSSLRASFEKSLSGARKPYVSITSLKPTEINACFLQLKICPWVRTQELLQEWRTFPSLINDSYIFWLEILERDCLGSILPWYPACEVTLNRRNSCYWQ